MLRPASMRIEGARCIRCALRFEIAPVICRDSEHIPVTAATLKAVAAYPTSAIAWCEEKELS